MIWSLSESRNKSGEELLYECEACIKFGLGAIHVLDADRLRRLVGELNAHGELSKAEQEKLADFSAVLLHLNMGTTFEWMKAIRMSSTTAPAPLPARITRMQPARARERMQSVLEKTAPEPVPIEPERDVKIETEPVIPVRTEPAPEPVPIEPETIETIEAETVPPVEALESLVSETSAQTPVQKNEELRRSEEEKPKRKVKTQKLFPFHKELDEDLDFVPKELLERIERQRPAPAAEKMETEAILTEAARYVLPGLFGTVVQHRARLTLLLCELQLHVSENLMNEFGIKGRRVLNERQLDQAAALFKVVMDDFAIDVEKRERKRKVQKEEMQEQRRQLLETEAREQRHLEKICRAMLDAYERQLSDRALFGKKKAGLPPELEKKFDHLES